MHNSLIQSFKEAGKIKIDQKFIDALNSGGIEEMHESNVITLRENFQYGTETSIEDNKLNELKELCKEALAAAKKEIYEDK